MNKIRPLRQSNIALTTIPAGADGAGLDRRRPFCRVARIRLDRRTHFRPWISNDGSAAEVAGRLLERRCCRHSPSRAARRALERDSRQAQATRPSSQASCTRVTFTKGWEKSLRQSAPAQSDVLLQTEGRHQPSSNGKFILPAPSTMYDPELGSTLPSSPRILT
jgi:hypothetical protein